QLRCLCPQRRILGLEPGDLLLRRLIGRPGRARLRRRGLQWARGQCPVSGGLLAGPVDLEPVPQGAAHDAEVLGDAADRGARGGLVQIDGLTTELLGVALPGHGSWIISLPQQMLDSACPRTGVRPLTTSAAEVREGAGELTITVQPPAGTEVDWAGLIVPAEFPDQPNPENPPDPVCVMAHPATSCEVDVADLPA